MKKITKMALAMVAAAVTSVSAASAVDLSVVPHVSGGIPLGATFDETTEKNIKDAKDAGADVGKSMGPMLSLGCEVNIGLVDLGAVQLGCQAGVNYTYTSYGYYSKAASYKSTIALGWSTIDFPILATVTAGIFEAEVGPYLSIPVGKMTFKSEYEMGGASGSSKDETSMTGVNFGLILGAAAEPQVGPGKLHIGARYLMDFTPTKVKPEVGDPMEVLTRRGLQLDVGYKIKLL